MALQELTSNTRLKIKSEYNIIYLLVIQLISELDLKHSHQKRILI